MTNLFLRRVELSNFRTYGESYVFDFDPAPGVTLVVGANGLGKTTLFDGIEWALTGEVSRFSEIGVDGRRKTRSPLTRLGQPDGSHRVSLEYSEGAPIDRGQGQEPAADELIELLRRPTWPNVGDLHRYLSITHFLGQAAHMRFSVRKPTDQWEALKGPAGVDRVNFVKERIGGQSARRAFNRVIQEASEALLAANTALADWSSLLEERDRLQQLAASEDSISPTVLIVAANDLARRILQLGFELEWTDATTAEAPEAVLSRLANLATEATEAGRSDEARLKGLEARAAEFLTLIEEINALTVRVSEIERRQVETAEKLRSGEAALAEAERGLTAGQQRLAAAQERLAQLARASAAAEQIPVAERSLNELDTALAQADEKILAGASRQSEFAQLIADASARVEERRRLSEQLSAARRRLDLTERWSHVRGERLRLEGLVGEADADVLRQHREVLLADERAVQAEEEEIRRRLRQLDERAGSIAQGVATIAAHLSDHDKDCPVCATPFPEGELVRRARAPRDRMASSAYELADQLAGVSVRRNTIAETLRDVNANLAQTLQTLTAIAQQRAQEDDLIQQLAEAGAAPSEEPDRDAAARLIVDLEGALQRLEGVVAGLPSLDELREQQQALAGDLEAEGARRAELIRRRGEHRAVVENARAVLRASPDLSSPESGFLADLEATRAAAADQAALRTAELHALSQAREQQRQALDAIRQAIANDVATLQAANTRLNQAGVRRQELVAAWLSTGASGEPDPTRLATMLLRATERGSELEGLTIRQRQLSAGYRRWTQDEALRGLETRIQARIGDLPDVAAVGDELRAAVLNAKSRLDAAQRARGRMEAVVADIQEKADTYAEGVLQPLNKTISRFSRALMTWSDTAITYSATHHAARSELRLNTVRTEPGGATAELDINPNLFFSEGQLSALSVSALLAASTSFRWSRWPALLMDDPLQHNDVIHASAFMDLMRQLVRQLGYQVIMSTHDSSEAAFLIRKCQSASIPLRVHELKPPGEAGLVSAAA